MTTANVSVAIALAGGFAMVLAASGTPLDLHDQIQAVRAQFAGKWHELVQPMILDSKQSGSIMPAMPSSRVDMGTDNQDVLKPAYDCKN